MYTAHQYEKHAAMHTEIATFLVPSPPLSKATIKQGT
jgi:hypothetical protein